VHLPEKSGLNFQSLVGVPASSTASERAFSFAGRTMEERRCQLNPDIVDGLLLLFVHGLKLLLLYCLLVYTLTQLIIRLDIWTALW